MKKRTALLLATGLLFMAQIACNFPLGNQVDAELAIAATLTYTSLQQPLPSQTPLPTATQMSLPSSPTPDERLIDQPTNYLLCQVSDLPAAGEYYFPEPDWKGVITNADIINDWAPGLGQEYVEQTGRVEGSWISYKRGVDGMALPQEFSCDVVRYTTAHGAKRAVTDYSMPQAFPDEFSAGEVSVDIGDASVVSVIRDRYDGKSYLYYEIEFSYLNYVVEVGGWGLESEVSHEVVEEVARVMLAKLKAAPRE